MTINAIDIAEGLEGRRNGTGWVARCPAHDDTTPSLQITDNGSKPLVYCHGGCSQEAVVKALLELGLWAKQSVYALPPQAPRTTAQPKAKSKAKGSNSGGSSAVEQTITGLHNSRTTPAQLNGLTVTEYCEAKGIEPQMAEEWGLTDNSYGNQKRIAIPYLDSSGNTVAIRYRQSLEGEQRFRWRSGDKPRLYGLWKFKAEDVVVVVEGESDCHTLWQHGYNALGVPGAATWNEDRDAAYFDKASKVYVVIEPDDGGKAVREWVGKSKIRNKVFLIESLPDDVSSLYLTDRQCFKEQFDKALADARPWTALDPEEWARAKSLSRDLSQSPNILNEFYQTILDAGLVGEENVVKLLYLLLTSRLLNKPISGVIKGVSSCGKSYCLEQTLKFFPNSAFADLTSMSEHALFYWDGDLRHKFLVLFESSGLQKSSIALTALRTLLSEGRLVYTTVEKDPTSGKFCTKTLKKEGPTGLLTTTTRNLLDRELETRLLTLNTEDSKKQTKAIILAQADEQNRTEPDYEKWQALQQWLEGANRKVVIPYAETLAGLIPPTDVRIRRDFGAVQNLIRTHAILHQRTRKQDSAGRIEASGKDYEAIFPLVSDVMARSVGAAVSPGVREFVEAVNKLHKERSRSITIKEAQVECGLTDSCARRYKLAACGMDLLVDENEGRGKRSLLTIGEPLPPEGGSVLPKVVQLCGVFKGGTETDIYKQYEVQFDGSEDWCLEMTKANTKAEAFAELEEKYGPDLIAVRQIPRHANTDKFVETKLEEINE